MKIRFWGVRGSIPAPGPETNRYGGNTSCVSVTTSSGGLIIIDMGTGLMHLGFFPPVFIGGNQFTVWGPGGSPEVLEEILEGQMDPNFSPLQTLKNFSATFDVRAIACGEAFEAEGAKVTAREHPHGAATALGFRIEDAGKTFVYASDVGYPEAGAPREAIAHYAGADVLLHDSTYRPDDQATRRNRGFSSYEEACAAAIAANVKRLVTFHYDQDYTDDDVDGIVRACEGILAPHGISVVPAREGDELEI